MELCLRRVWLQYLTFGVAGFEPESVATFNQNQWQSSTGIDGNFQPESVAGFNQNTQLFERFIDAVCYAA
jgi:hypothetical protein